MKLQNNFKFKKRRTVMTKKAVAILLAVYEPDIPWLIELLDSLNRQTYENIRLYVRDDASPHMQLEKIEHLLKKHITNFPFVLNRNAKNLGSNKTFGALIEDAKDAHYVAFCDQDDVWLPNKIEKTVHLFESSPLSPTLVCSDVTVMDGDGHEIASSMTKHRKRHVFLRGTDVAKTLIYRNFAMGCTMLMERERALQYLPFPTAVVHDHYLAFRAACDGAIDFLEEPQLRYRVYGGNQTGVMTGVLTKEDYFIHRICVFDERLRAFEAVSAFEALKQARSWCVARVANFHRERGGARALWKQKKCNPVTSLFEIIVLRLPTPLFRSAIRLVQKRIL